MRVIGHKGATVYDTNTRSTLEARWAIFFHELNLKWKYEPTTLCAGNVYYTPDFEVARLGYIEIKPTLDLFISETSERVKKIAAANPEIQIFVFCGDRVEISTTALYQRDKIYAPTPQQMRHKITLAAPGGLNTPDAESAYINRATMIANATKFNEWQSMSEILPHVIEGLEIQAKLKEQLSHG